jgi:hypothetical protein
LPAAAFGADQPLAPIGQGRFGAVASSHLGRIGLHLTLAALAPNDQPDACGGSVAERQSAGRERTSRRFVPLTYRLRCRDTEPGRSDVTKLRFGDRSSPMSHIELIYPQRKLGLFGKSAVGISKPASSPDVTTAHAENGLF